MAESPLTGSFRDPSGSVFVQDGLLLRRINPVYEPHYTRLMASGLYEKLVGAGLLVPHEEVSEDPAAGRVIRPRLIDFISYPYEWSFSQLQDAALATLKIQSIALDHDMSLKDASAYNLQFHHGKPILIDTLSFEQYRSGEPWVAYRQFCQHFLAPLALMARCDIRLSQLLRTNIDGVPLDLAAGLLPWRTRLNPGLFLHIHAHSRMQSRHAHKAADKSHRRLSPSGLRGLIDNLRATITALSWQPAGTTWADYYEATNYTDAALEEKRRLVTEFIAAVNPKTVWDLGANVGLFSRLAADGGRLTVAFDIDPAAVEKNYLEVRAKKESNLLPLVLDLANPSPALGWAHAERASLVARGPADLVMALALVHHLAIGNNLPFAHIADFLSKIGRALIVEFVPKEDSQTQRLLASRDDIFTEYDETNFRRAFEEYFVIERAEPIAGSSRTLYLMRRKEPDS